MRPRSTKELCYSIVIVIYRSYLLVTLLGLASILSFLRNLSSTSRSISSSNERIIIDAPYISDSKLHYMWDKELETMYSTTHERIRGQVSFILNDNEETNNGSNDFQHKGILRTSSKKHGKWMKIRYLRSDVEFVVAGETIRKAGTNYSKYVDDMRLVVDANETIIFPFIEMENNVIGGDNTDNHLCNLLQRMTGRKRLDVIPEAGIPPITLNVTADCDILNQKMKGQGDMILSLYSLRMITALAKVEFEFHCQNKNFAGLTSGLDNPIHYQKEKSRKLRSVFPWFASYQSSTDEKDPWPHMGNAPTHKQLCSTSSRVPVDDSSSMPLEKMADQIRNDVRKMALQLIGSQKEDPKRIHSLIPLDIEPWIPNIVPDDVIIHFPCYSDVHDWKKGSRVGIMHFSEYTKHIHQDTKTIGIVLEVSRERGLKSDKDICHHTSTLLDTYLRSFYKNQVSISIHENDSLPLQYARIAVAKQSFSSFSTFGMIPIIGTFGKGYFQLSDLGKTKTRDIIIRKIISEKYQGFENINLMTGDVLSPEKIATMTFSEISNWLLKSS